MKTDNTINLHCLVDNLSGNFPSCPSLYRLVNEIDPALQADTSSAMLAQVLSSALDHIAAHAKGPVRISAKTYHNIVLLQVKYDDQRRKPEIEEGLADLRSLLEHLGGCIYVNDQKSHETTLSVTFLDHALSRVA